MIDKETLEKMIGRQQKISDNAYMNYQESGIQRYMTRHEQAEDQIEILQMALNVADIKAENVGIRAALGECAAKALDLLHDQRYLDGGNIGEIGQLLHALKAYGKLYRVVFDRWGDD